MKQDQQEQKQQKLPGPKQTSARRGHSTFVPLLFVALTLLLMAGFQSYHLVQQKNNLVSLKSGQDRPLEEARKVRAQFNSIARSTLQLANLGNRNAATLLEQLKSLGVTVEVPPAQ